MRRMLNVAGCCNPMVQYMKLTKKRIRNINTGLIPIASKGDTVATGYLLVENYLDVCGLQPRPITVDLPTGSMEVEVCCGKESITNARLRLAWVDGILRYAFLN